MAEPGDRKSLKLFRLEVETRGGSKSPARAFSGQRAAVRPQPGPAWWRGDRCATFREVRRKPRHPVLPATQPGMLSDSGGRIYFCAGALLYRSNGPPSHQAPKWRWKGLCGFPRLPPSE